LKEVRKGFRKKGRKEGGERENKSCLPVEFLNKELPVK